MQKVIVATDPGHDIPTRHLSYWVQEIVAHLSSIEDVSIKVLSGSDAVPEKLSVAIQQEDPQLVLLNGHGSYEAIYGHDDVVLVSTTANDGSVELYKKRIVHTLSCSSGKELGRHMVKMGAKTFIGYEEPFHFYNLGDPDDLKGKDIVAALFLEPAHEAVKRLSNGSTAGEAYLASQDKYKENLLWAMTSKDANLGNNRTLIAAALYHDLKHQVLHGDTEARL